MTDHRLQCACGKLRGRVVLPTPSGRASCYCKDCQAFARWLVHDGVLNSAGGTDIVATLPSHVKIEQGLEQLACMSLSPNGLLRWYAGCCRTPIGNTPRDRKLHYVGLVHNCLAEPIEPSFGPSRWRINTTSATKPVESTPIGAFLAILRVMPSMFAARFGDRFRGNPFFDVQSGTPVRAPQVPSHDEASRLRVGT